MSEELQFVGSIPRALVAVSFVLASAYGLGRGVCGAVEGRRRSLESALVMLAAGGSLLALVGLILGVGGLLGGKRPVWLLVGLATVGLVVAWRDRRAWPGVAKIAPSRASVAWVVVSAAGLGLVTLGPALCFPSGWDELVYHHELPRRWLADGWPAFYPDLPYSGFPSLGEILFWLMGPIEGAIAPRLLMWCAWVAGLILVYRLVRRRVAPFPAGALTAALSLSSALLMVSANCYVEALQILGVAALLIVLDQRRGWREQPTRQAMIIGVLAGGAAAIKLTGVAIAAMPLIWLAGVNWQVVGRHRSASSYRGSAIYAATYLLVAILVSAPFYLRPWWLTGNPFYPYYGEWFAADAATVEMSRYHHALGAAFGVHGPAAFLAAPMLLSFDTEIFDGDFGWQLLGIMGLSAVAIWRGWRRKRLKFLLVPVGRAGWLYGFWFLTAQQARFVIPAVMCLLPVAAAGLQTFRGKPRSVAIGLLLAASLISVPWRNAGQYMGSWLAAAGAIRTEDYLDVSTDREYLPLVRAIDEETTSAAHLLLVLDQRGFYVPRRHRVGTPFFQAAFFTPPEDFRGVEDIRKALAAPEITHVVLATKPTGPDVPPAWEERIEGFIAAIQRCVDAGVLKPVWRSERHVLFEVAAHPSDEQ
jgi:hypothetical protein